MYKEKLSEIRLDIVEKIVDIVKRHKGEKTHFDFDYSPVVMGSDCGGFWIMSGIELCDLLDNVEGFAVSASKECLNTWFMNFEIDIEALDSILDFLIEKENEIWLKE